MLSPNLAGALLEHSLPCSFSGLGAIGPFGCMPEVLRAAGLVGEQCERCAYHRGEPTRRVDRWLGYPQAMKVQSVSPILNVSNVPASLRWFESLGWSRTFTWNDAGMIPAAADTNAHGPAQFAGMCIEMPGDAKGPTLFLCKDGQGSRDPRPMTDPASDSYGGVWMSWWVDDVNAAHTDCLRANIEIVRPPVDEPWGVREFLIRHPDGHYFRISGAPR